METRTVEIDLDLLPLMLDSCRTKREEVVARRDEEIAEWDRKIARLEALANPPAPTITANGRVKRGQSEEILTQFLKAQNGKGATIREINRATGTKYGTTLRLLNIFRDKGWVKRVGDSRDSRWSWKAGTTP